jgi:ribosome-associated protein
LTPRDRIAGNGSGADSRKSPSVPLREIEIGFVRSSGPGGQNVNKVNSKAVLRWAFGESRALPAAVRERFAERYSHRLTRGDEIVISSDRYRDQGRNAADCVAKLQAMVAAVAMPPRPRKATRPTRAARERRLVAKHRRAQVKQRRGAPAAED